LPPAACGRSTVGSRPRTGSDLIAVAMIEISVYGEDEAVSTNL